MIVQRHIGIVVFDLEVVEKFWQEVMGFTRINIQHEDGEFIDKLLKIDRVKLTTVKMVGEDSSIIELLKFHFPPSLADWKGGVNTTGITHIAFTIPDILNFYKKNLKYQGLIFLNPPALSADGKVMATYARGPEGILFEFVQVL
jgi:catechol 2,3-dioxygenase-like lactoylglutathione lyase family enzyme